MRLILDLQACQTESHKRGIGRYVASLASAMLKLRGCDCDTLVALDGTYPEQADRVRASLRDQLPANRFTRYHYPRPLLPDGNPADPLRAIASQLIARHIASLRPDAVLCGSVFEGFVEPAVTCENLIDIPGAVAAAIIYDLVPLVFPDQYLGAVGKRDWYFRKLSAIRNCDLLLAISKATRQDAIDRLGVSADRIVNISGAADDIFRPLAASRGAQQQRLQRWGITRPYILYTGNGDFRKNVAGLLEAFARLPPEVRKKYQLVLNQAGSDRVCSEWLLRYGFAADEVVVTGYVTDRDLVTLLSHCDLFVFPSLYEGFGLPVLEAMKCGAPVIGGDNSSIRELITDPAARFDARDPAAISMAMQRALTDAAFRAVLCEEGRQRATAFSWTRSAQQALDAIAAAVERKRPARWVPVKPRRRLAVFTPLPPERTGIASYSAELLPYLARHFSIDVYTTCVASGGAQVAPSLRVRPWQQFESRAAEYDGVVYQMGNSPFHSHMVDLLARYPGIVVLHDFFLSSMFWHTDRHGGHPGLFAGELAYSHGAAALADLAGADGDNVCRRRYPCNRRVLEQSIGVLVHSPGVHALLARYGLQALDSKVEVVPQLRMLSPTLDPDARAAIRARLGFNASDWLVCSFGFVADTKLSDRLVRALLDDRLSPDQSIHLIFVGELDGGAYGEQLQRLILDSGLAERIRITGFVNDQTYEDYLAVADAAVQLRALSRGETSRAVLDCLAHGIPLIVNAHGTMNDYPDSVLVRTCESVTPVELADALVRLHGDSGFACKLGAAGRAYIADVHSPVRVAEGYAAAIDEMLRRDAYVSAPALAADIAPAITACGGRSAVAGAVRQALVQNLVAPTIPRIVVDLSEVVHVDYGTGIHRVVRSLTRELLMLASDGSFACVPAYLSQRSYDVASDYAAARLGAAQLTAQGAVEFAPGDTLVFLDSAWDKPERFLPVIRAADDAGAEIVGYVHDLIPLRHPETCVPHMPNAFRRWLEHTVRTSDAIICVSRATADDLVAFIEEKRLRHRSGLRIDYVHHGSDLDGPVAGTPTSETASVFGADRRLTFLMVGTLEPRKEHALVLEAFDQLWADGHDVGLCLVGKLGWKMEAFASHVRAHAEFGTRLHWLEHISDVDLRYAYSHATALVQASRAEGFGLPLLEAARYGTPVVCSDISVFREVAGDDAYYFRVGSVAGLKKQLLRLITDPEARKRRRKRERTWRDAATDLLAVLGPHAAYRTLPGRCGDADNAALDDFGAALSLWSPPDTMRVGEIMQTRVTVKNTGQAIWSAGGARPVHVSYYWTNAAGDVIDAEGLRANLPRDVEPGETVGLLVALRAPNAVADARLVCTLVQEGVAWFDHRQPESRACHRVRVVA